MNMRELRRDVARITGHPLSEKRPHISDDIGTTAWPIALLEDRYGGAYSDGNWIAIANADIDVPGRIENRVAWVFRSDVFGGDNDCMDFWDGPAKQIPWLAAGESPELAIQNLYLKLWYERHPE
jgi:hypothetical protein